jgi:serine/threonine protein phosphatase PrpC
MLACDGIWDCLNNEECIKTLRTNINDQIKNNKFTRTDPVEKMLGEILAPNTEDGIGTDNMTAILITFNDNMNL